MTDRTDKKNPPVSTRRGDDGTMTLLGSGRMSKSDARIVVPGGSYLGALPDVARAVVRRAERSLVAAGYAEEHPDAVRVVNRLSDLFFVAARNADGGHDLSRG